MQGMGGISRSGVRRNGGIRQKKFKGFGKRKSSLPKPLSIPKILGKMKGIRG